MKPTARLGTFIIIYAIFLHVGWGLVFLLSGERHVTTPTAYHLLFVRPRMLGVLLLVTAGFAFYGMKRPGLRGLLASLPQNTLLLVSAASALSAVLVGEYPDGVLRPQLFIFVDQFPTLLTAVLHVAALILYHGVGWKTPEF